MSLPISPPASHRPFFDNLKMKIALVFSLAAFGLGADACANLIADPTFANSTTINSLPTTYTQDGNWDLMQLSPGSSKATFNGGNNHFNPGNKGDIYAAPLNVNGQQIQLISGQIYTYSVKVYGATNKDVYIYAGSTQQVALLGGGGGGATYTGTFTASTSGTLAFVIPSADPAMGLMNVSVDFLHAGAPLGDFLRTPFGGHLLYRTETVPENFRAKFGGLRAIERRHSPSAHSAWVHRPELFWQARRIVRVATRAVIGLLIELRFRELVRGRETRSPLSASRTLPRRQSRPAW